MIRRFPAVLKRRYSEGAVGVTLCAGMLMALLIVPPCSAYQMRYSNSEGSSARRGRATCLEVLASQVNEYKILLLRSVRLQQPQHIRSRDGHWLRASVRVLDIPRLLKSALRAIHSCSRCRHLAVQADGLRRPVSARPGIGDGARDRLRDSLGTA